jgi:hypothetical protein
VPDTWPPFLPSVRVLDWNLSLASAGMAFPRDIDIDEEEVCRCRAERASLLDAHRARHCHGLTVKVEAHLEVRVHPLDNADQVSWHAELVEHCAEYAPWHRIKPLTKSTNSTQDPFPCSHRFFRACRMHKMSPEPPHPP